jgi:hypothetical protein
VGILATEFAWARRLLRQVEEKIRGQMGKTEHKEESKKKKDFMIIVLMAALKKNGGIRIHGYAGWPARRHSVFRDRTGRHCFA